MFRCRLRGRLLEEYFDQNQVSTISSCYEEALIRDPTCSYSMERLIKMHRKGVGYFFPSSTLFCLITTLVAELFFHISGINTWLVWFWIYAIMLRQHITPIGFSFTKMKLFFFMHVKYATFNLLLFNWHWLSYYPNQS